jgi:hypothetical protein
LMHWATRLMFTVTGLMSVSASMVGLSSLLLQPIHKYAGGITILVTSCWQVQLAGCFPGNVSTAISW